MTDVPPRPAISSSPSTQDGAGRLPTSVRIDLDYWDKYAASASDGVALMIGAPTVQEFVRRARRCEELQSVAMAAIVPLEVIYCSDKDRPIAEISQTLRDQIEEAVLKIRLIVSEMGIT